jgi:hypothetical protein
LDGLPPGFEKLKIPGITYFPELEEANVFDTAFTDTATTEFDPTQVVFHDGSLQQTLAYNMNEAID